MKFFSQVGQDSFLLENFFRGKRKGIFVDVGAYDGQTYSNSLFFERYMGWTGLCIEPLPSAYEKLAAIRTSRCLPVCVSDFEGEADFVECDAGLDEKMLSGLSCNFDQRHVERIRRTASRSEVRKVAVRRLSNVLREHSLFHVDYCSIDTEGAELNILSELDLEQFHISVFTIENNYNDVRLTELMAAKNYDLVAKLEHDDVYCRRDVKRLARTSVICAVWHGDPNRHELLRSHQENLARQTVPIASTYVFDGDDRPPPWFEGQAICVRAPLTVYQAWNVALSIVETPLVMNLNLDDRLAPDGIERLEQALLKENAAAAAGDWNICYSRSEADAVRRCYPASELPFVDAWPPPDGTRTRLGSGSIRRTLGPAVLWRVNCHMGAPRFPWRFNEGSLIKIAGDMAWWDIIGNYLRKKIISLPVVIGNYHSHPLEQAEFRPYREDEGDLLRQVGPSLI